MPMSSSLRIPRWFAPPMLASTEATRCARALWSISWSFFGLLAAFLVAAGVATPSLMPRRIVSIALVGLLVGGLHVLNRRGHTLLASRLLIIGLAAIVTQRAWNAGGVHARVDLFYMMIVLIGAGLLSIEGGLIAAIACVLSAALLSGAELAGWLVVPAVLPTSPAEPFIASTLAVAIALVSLTLLFRQATDVATEDMVNMFVHDMRSPLTVIMGRLSMLRSDAARGTKAAEHADAAMTETVRLNRMANNLLDVSRLSGASLSLERRSIDVCALVNEVVTALGTLDPTRHISISCAGEVACECDAELLQRILENLVSNALKHTPRGGRIGVDASRGEGVVRIVVEDDGPGIPAEARERIFERYSARGMRARGGQHSVGLGLAFCKLAAAAHGGRIWVEDAQPHGSRFVLELPSGGAP